MNEGGSVSPLEQDNSSYVQGGVSEGGGDVWDKVLEPFDQDKEEGKQKEEERRKSYGKRRSEKELKKV